MNFQIISVGKWKEKAQKEIFAEYQKRLKNKLELIEVEESKKTGIAEIKKQEAENILKKCEGKTLVALDSKGKNLTSEDFSSLLVKLKNSASKNICFVIGGSHGIDETILKKAAAIISFGNLTWPHLMARIMLAEQIYRAHTIENNHPYHK